MNVLTPGYDMPYPWYHSHNVLRIGPDLVIVVATMHYPAGQQNNGAVRFNGIVYRLAKRPGMAEGIAVQVGTIYDQPLRCMN